MASAAAPMPARCERLVLFDGTCGFCDASVRWALERDPEARLCFAPLQGATAASLRARHPRFPEGLDSVVFVDASDGTERIYLRSEAVFRIWSVLEPERRLLRWLRKVPRPLADLGYLAVKSVRHRLFGRLDECRVPSPEERARFLD